MQHGTQIGLGPGLATGISPVDPGHDPRTFFYHVGEQAKLVAGARSFALQPLFRQSGFQFGSLRNHIPGAFDFGRDGTQEPAPLAARGPAIGCESVVGQTCGPVDFVGLGGKEIGEQKLSGAGIGGTETRGACSPAESND